MLVQYINEQKIIQFLLQLVEVKNGDSTITKQNTQVGPIKL